jgi:hypothetical protein
MIATTTSNSINVNPRCLATTETPKEQTDPTDFGWGS